MLNRASANVFLGFFVGYGTYTVIYNIPLEIKLLHAPL
jgi:hypothetical protein